MGTKRLTLSMLIPVINTTLLRGVVVILMTGRGTMLEVLGETVISLLNTLKTMRLPLSLLITIINIMLLSRVVVIPMTRGGKMMAVNGPMVRTTAGLSSSGNIRIES